MISLPEALTKLPWPLAREYRNGDVLTTISVEHGAVIVCLTFERANQTTALHSHSFDHRMECVQGSALIEIDGVSQIVRKGERYLVEAHKQHGVRALEPDTILRCVHEHEDIRPNSEDHIPAEWLERLTDKAE